MANLSEDIQCAGFDTRPPMLDMTDFASWQQRIRLYYRGAPHLGPERPRVYSDLFPKEKDRGLRDSNYDQLYAYLKEHETHANENKMMLDRFTQHVVDPLVLMSNGGGAAGYGGVQNRVGNDNPGQARQVKCYNCKGGQANAINEDVDEQPVQDLALNVDNVFQADDCDAFDSDFDEAPTT
uniref:Integrase, catalytic region, zinc finger, CCHC-type, peptidase aspartic, catalytic n=1 Tax=Tanacetum cinerariifolium TaxID=118510 RepID=A0A699IUX5_TANCI|nr:hypothetical protein [Tanacetum cinerariifolium]